MFPASGGVFLSVGTTDGYRFACWPTAICAKTAHILLHLPISDVKKTRLYPEVFGEGREKGRLEPVLNQRTRRCGALTPTHLDRTHALDSTQLGTLGEALLDFGSVADLDAWLREH
ncbi:MULTISPECIES: DUF4351 domain-containing protein [unclassified Thiocapsa]|uniref:DUF4351 domain-containing protein n=1 Tax=unclassified Thiocapsa TaxID=2641286 RepID=UPI0035AD83BE